MNYINNDLIKKKISNKYKNFFSKNLDLKNLFIIRASELAFIELSKMGKIKGPLHTSVGQEAVAVGVCSNLNKKDALFSTHRGHGHYIAHGGNLTMLILELFGDKRGCCGGLGGSMHVAELNKNIIGSNGIVGGGVPIACGFAMGQKINKDTGISVVFFGDGAINQGVVMESLNMAAIYELPILFICENNFYAYSTKSRDMTKKNIYIRANGFGIKSYSLNGMNLTNILKKLKIIIYGIRKLKKPAFVEIKTYRFHRHFTSEMPRKNDYIDYKIESRMAKIDPCLIESRKKLNLDKINTEKLILDIRDCIVKNSLKLIS